MRRKDLEANLSEIIRKVNNNTYRCSEKKKVPNFKVLLSDM
jgi:hypothetical protein